MTINPDNQLNNKAEFAALLQFIYTNGRRLTLRKRQCILQEGNPCDFFFFVESGAFRAYRWVQESEVTLGFSFQGDVDTCPYSYINGLPSLDTIEALTESKVIQVFRKDIQAFFKTQPLLTDFTQKLLSNYIEILIQRLIEVKTRSAGENYKALFERQPAEVAKIPLQHIASYLGISKERLSRIRRKASFDIGQN